MKQFMNGSYKDQEVKQFSFSRGDLQQDSITSSTASRTVDLPTLKFSPMPS